MDIDIVTQNLASSNLKKVEKNTVNPQKDAQLKEACAGFEAILIHTMIKSMRKTLPGNALFPESNTGSIYQSLQDQNLAEHLSKGESSLGLKDYLYEKLKDSI